MASYQKILIVRFSSIGDIVLTTPVIRCVKEQTGAEIHFLTKAPFASILEANPYVDRVLTIEKDLKELALPLVQAGYDGCIDLHGNLRTLELKARLANPFARHPRPRITTFDKLNLEKFLLTKLKIDRMPDVHIIQRYLAAAKPFGVVDDGKGLDYFIKDQDRVNPATAGLPATYVAFVIGAAHATKRLTEPQMRQFCQQLDHPVALIGGPAERKISDRIADGLPDVMNTCGQFNLGGSADLVRQATVVVTHDTGMMHVAAAFQKPIISVWGNTVPELGMYPYLPGQKALETQRRQEVLDLDCRPCSKIGFAQCPKGHFKCIKNLSVSELKRACEKALND